MIQFVALLRGINISGKNKVPMKELKNSFEELGFKDVVTYINSGNVIFTSDKEDLCYITEKIIDMIKEKFGLEIPVYVISIEELEAILKEAPTWWGNDNKEIYDNIIFILPPTTYEEVFEEIGDAKKEYEQISHYKNTIFWSFTLKDYSKTNWIKTASSKINNRITIRTANTIKKVIELSKKI
ncbi:MAG: DUF1697 domain-containing protein [Bacilli bacterium]|nr:DUF1697 domain-containing protein [Bacilli bacterium]